MIICPKGHDGTFVIRNTIRQALGTGVIRVDSAGNIIEIIDPGDSRIDLRCDECKANFSLIIKGGRRTAAFASGEAINRTAHDETMNTPEPVENDEDEEDED